MKKFALAALAVATIGVTAAFAGPIEDRQALMKSFAPSLKDATALSRGTTPFTPAAAKAAMDPLVAAADKIPGMFPKGSDTGATKTTAAPAIWSDAAGFKAVAMKFGADAKAASAATDQTAFAAALKNVQADCGGCHKTYRVAAN